MEDKESGQKCRERRMKKLRVVIYARYSSHNQTEQSIDGQLRTCHEFAKQNNYEVVYVYVDRAMTGKNDDRPEFQRMLRESKRHLFDVVLVYSFDRFARNRYDSAFNKRLLKLNGVRVVSATEPIPETPEGILLEALLEGTAEYVSAELARKTSRGMRESAVKGMSTGGTIPLGYRINADKKYELDEKESPIVEVAFRLYSSGEQIKDILAHINSLGLRTRPSKRSPSGQPINATVLQWMIKRYAYFCGAIVSKQYTAHH